MTPPLRPLRLVDGSQDPRPLVFVTVGTDHHPFGRLVEWVDVWLAGGGDRRARCFVQRGTAPAPRLAESKEYLSREELDGMLAEATVVVTHGGPGTIAEARRAGTTPIVVPRLRSLGEHVDDHQARFARRIAGTGQAIVAQSAGEFARALDAAVAGTLNLRASGASGHVATSVARFGALADALLVRSARRAAQPVRSDILFALEPSGARRG